MRKKERGSRNIWKKLPAGQVTTEAGGIKRNLAQDIRALFHMLTRNFELPTPSQKTLCLKKNTYSKREDRQVKNQMMEVLINNTNYTIHS